MSKPAANLRSQRELLDILAQAGVTVERLVAGGSHLLAYCLGPAGRFVVPISGSPSCPRSQKNFRAEVRRYASGAAIRPWNREKDR